MVLEQYNIKQLKDISEGELLLQHEQIDFKHILIDSRKKQDYQNSLFFAIVGTRHNGHKYIEELYKKGVRNFVIQETGPFLNELKANFFICENVVTALQKLTQFHRLQFDIPVIGITGSNGKTIIKEWLFQLLKPDFNLTRSPKSFNSQVGVPLSVWQLKKEHNMAIFEAGISRPMEMEALSDIIQPTLGIMTNIGQAHDEYFENWEEKVKEKLMLFKNVEELIYCKDHKVIHEAVIHSKFDPKKTFIWSKKTSADLLISKIREDEKETYIQGIFKNQFIDITIPFLDSASIENAIHCWCVLLHLGIDNEVIKERMLTLAPIAMRLELKEGINQCAIINDSYNSDLSSLNIALDFLNQQKGYTGRVLILSDMLESTRDEEQLYKDLSKVIHEKGVDLLIGIGKQMFSHQSLFDVDSHFFESTDRFLMNLKKFSFNHHVILLKGARNFEFEQITNVLQKKAHETIMEIDLQKLTGNINYFKSLLKPNVKMMAMVKAFSYGSGSYEIASTLEFNHLDYLGVAYVDEGVELRKSGISLPIMVMNPEQTGYDAMIHHSLEPEIYNFNGLKLFLESLERNSYLGNQAYPIHLKIDTGMNRLGFKKEQVMELIMKIKNAKNCKIESVFTHLASTDEVSQDSFTHQQVKEFKEISEQITSHFDYPIIKHCLNSHGILRFSDYQMDMVRLGIGLYGVSADPFHNKYLEEVSNLKTVVSQIKHVKKGESVGYSRKGFATEDMIIATLPIGYADGLRRSLSNGRGKVYIQDKPAPIVGNVCMDMCMVDITHIPAEEGDEVIIFGEGHSITELARDMETIPYETLCGISSRVKRVYLH